MSDRFHQMKTAIEEGRELSDFTSSDLIHQIEKVDAIQKRVVDRVEWVSASVWAVGILATAVGAGTLVVFVLPLAKYASVPFLIIGAVILILAAYALSWLRRTYKGWEAARDLCVANRALLGEKLVAAGEAEREAEEKKRREEQEAEEARIAKERAEREAEENKRREEQEAAEAKERETARAAAEARVARERKAAEARAAVRPLWEKFRDGERNDAISATWSSAESRWISDEEVRRRSPPSAESVRVDVAPNVEPAPTAVPVDQDEAEQERVERDQNIRRGS